MHIKVKVELNGEEWAMGQVKMPPSAEGKFEYSMIRWAVIGLMKDTGITFIKALREAAQPSGKTAMIPKGSRLSEVMLP